jgi:hypothetical protein
MMSQRPLLSTGLGTQDYEQVLTPLVYFVSELGGSMPFPHAPASASSLST